MTQLDLQIAQAARDISLERAERGATEAWKREAYDLVKGRYYPGGEFTSDDIWAAGLQKPAEPRALGTVLMKLAREGLITKTGRYVQTAQVSRHAAPIAVWRFV